MAVVATAACGSRAGEPPPEVASLVGNWRIVRFVENGRPHSPHGRFDVRIDGEEGRFLTVYVTELNSHAFSFRVKADALASACDERLCTSTLLGRALLPDASEAERERVERERADEVLVQKLFTTSGFWRLQQDRLRLVFPDAEVELSR